MSPAPVKKPPPAADATKAMEATSPPPGEEDEQAAALARVTRRKHALVGALIGVVVLVVGVGLWLALSSRHPAAPAKEASHPPVAKPVPPVDAEMARKLQALQQKNAELAAQVKALEQEKAAKEAPPPPTAQTETAPKSDASDMVLSNKDPKASAQALKRMIEEMNAASGDNRSR